MAYKYDNPEEAYEAALDAISEADFRKSDSLSLKNLGLTHLPPEIDNLTDLYLLDLSLNQLTELPTEITQLANLIFLDLSYNKLTTLKPEIGNLTSLTELDLSSNQLTSAPPEIGKLTNLTKLFFYGNQLNSVPPEIGKLKKLTKLHLFDNLLTSLPSEIGNLDNLFTLSLSFNQLNILPQEITKLSKLTELDLRSNPNLNIPPEILFERETPQIILEYIARMHAEENQRLNEAKIILVGQGAVGKTSVVNQLIHNRFNPEENITRGVNITDWKVEDGEEDIAVHLWDFGGQEIMHATHQFFLTQRSLYLLVLDSRLDEGENKLDYWMKTIEAYGGGSPVIVVANKADQRSLDMDQRGILAKYRNVQAIISTSCASGDGIADLRSEIETTIQGMEHVKDQFPQSWYQVKQDIEKLKAKRSTMSYDRYIELCEDAGVEKPESQEAWIGVLHDLGTVFNFRDDAPLANTQILNPEWVTTGVYQIINDEDLIENDKGVLTGLRMKEILQLPGYNRPNEQQFITAMMRRFELSYTFQHDGGECHLIPSLLPKQGPDTGDWADSLTFEYHYDVLHPSLIARFIVRSYPMIEDQLYWRTGAVLSMGENEALVRADYADNLIRIQVRGPQPTQRDLLAAVRLQLEAIHRSIPNLEVRQLVPIPGHPDILEDYQHLLDLEQMGIPMFVPRGLRKQVLVKDLLDGYESALSRQKRRHGDETEEIPEYPPDMVFISYAHADQAEVLKIHEKLDKRFTPWIDKYDIAVGKKWEREIERAVKNAKAFVFCLSEESFNRRGVLQLEIQYALKEMDKLLPEDSFIFPVRLNECKVPERMEHIQYLDWFEPDAEARLIEAIEAAISRK